jgi:two-component system CheB/CheR fusion protein
MAESPLRDRTILVVEDDGDTRDVVRRLLELLGARVTVAADGMEGLEQLQRLTPDAVLCDLTMPIMDGIEFALRMRRDPRHRRALLIALTGRQGQADILRTWEVGFDAHLVKPVNPEMLSALARRLSSRSGTDVRRGA